MTHLELLQRLPSPYREQAIENCTQSESWLNMQGTTLTAALAQLFNWKSSPQGWLYWYNIYKRAMNGELDDPSVTLPREDWEAIASILNEHESTARYSIAIQSQLNQSK